MDACGRLLQKMSDDIKKKYMKTIYTEHKGNREAEEKRIGSVKENIGAIKGKYDHVLGKVSSIKREKE